jgi:glycine cleavage system aminomethyltransferase T
VDKPEYVQVAQAELISKGLFTSSYSSYALPFEIAFSRLDRQLHEMRKVWTEVVVRVDGLGTQELS